MMINMKKIQALFFFIVFSQGIYGQINNELFNSIDRPTSEFELHPDSMIFTQRLFWVKKGLMRSTNLLPISNENRDREVRIRRKMLIAHQVIGYTTLVGMIAQGVLEAFSYPEIRFNSKMSEHKKDSILIDGQMDFHGVLKNNTIAANKKQKNNQALLKGSFDILPSQYAIQLPSFRMIKLENHLSFVFKLEFNQ